MINKIVSEHNRKRLEKISIYLRELRFSEGMTQSELSQTLQIHRNTIQHAENSFNITLLSLFELADAFDISLKELFQDIE